MSTPLKVAVLLCCLALIGSLPVAAADVVIDMTGRISRDCLVNNGLGIRLRYDHANQLCHLTEASANGPLLSLNWGAPLCKQSPTDNRCLEWSAGGCCVYCGFRGTQHTAEGTKGKGLAPGQYVEVISATPYVTGAGSVTGFFAFNWTPSGDINDIRACAGGSADFTLNPGETSSVMVIVPDLGQTTRLEKDGGDGQKTMLGGTLANTLDVKASGVDNVGGVNSKGGLAIAWTVTDPGGIVVSQFSSVTDAQTGISAVTVSLGGASGVYTITASCSECIANREVSFTATALTNEQARLLSKLSDDDAGIIGTRLENPLRVRVINSVTGESEVGIAINFDRENPTSCPPGTSVSPARTATDGSGIAKAFVVLGLIPGSCQIRASCATCPNSPSVFFSVQGILPPDINITNGGDGPSRTGGGPSPSGGDGDSSGNGPLKIEYGIADRGFRLTRPPDAGFVGVLTGDAITFKAVPSDGSFQWSGAGISGAGSEATATYNQEFFIGAPAAVTLSRSSDGKYERANVLVELRPTGRGTLGALAIAVGQLCGGSSPPEAGAKCAFMLVAHPAAYLWAENNFEPHGRYGGSCHNNCCDAGKHAFWHAAVTRFVGLEFSQLFGVAHEKDGIDRGDPHNETVMDLHNNRLGQNIGLNSSGLMDTVLIGDNVLQRIGSGDALVLYDARNAEGLSMLESSSRCGR